MILVKLIRRLTDRDILGGVPELINSISRFASRGVLTDDKVSRCDDVYVAAESI